jgi:bifunctional N-acetylglucosamine-1-phosphate-uridyltransferase/glucosamine-1-phosphate-acetyltransferase GlmU-like protein
MELALEKGVTILQPGTVTIEYDVEIGMDTVIYPSTYIASGVKIGANCRIGPFVYLNNVEIKDNEKIVFDDQKPFRENVSGLPKAFSKEINQDEN